LHLGALVVFVVIPPSRQPARDWEMTGVLVTAAGKKLQQTWEVAVAF
jgi:hypothetical protein